MKHFFSVLIFVVYGLIGAGQGEVSDTLLRQHVGALAHDSMKGRFTGRPEIRLAAGYIAAQMESIGLEKMADSKTGFLIPWNRKRLKVYKGEHIVGIIPGVVNKEKLIIFSAHYDHIGLVTNQRAFPFGAVNKHIKGDSVFNGANDDATGVAALLELARLFKDAKPAYTLMFVAFSGEELGLLGSTDFCEKLVPANVMVNVNLEMLGRPNDNPPFILEEEGQDKVLKALNNNLVKLEMGYPENYFTTDPYPEQRLFTRSDNYSFHKRKITSFTIMGTSPFDDYYHSAGDEVETIQFPQMRAIVHSVYLALLPLVTVNTFPWKTPGGR